MVDNEFWSQCVEHGVIVVPFTLYEKYDKDGNYAGAAVVRFTCLHATTFKLYESSFWLRVDAESSSLQRVGATPEEALQKYIDARK